MSTFTERLEARWEIDEPTTTWGDRQAYLAGARAALELAAEEIEDAYGSWRKLAAYDPKRFPGAPCEATDGVALACEQMLARAAEIKEGR